MKNVSYFTLKAPFVFKMFKVLSRLFNLIRKIRLISKKNSVTTWLTDNSNTQICGILSKGDPDPDLQNKRSSDV